MFARLRHFRAAYTPNAGLFTARPVRPRGGESAAIAGPEKPE
jgi:hypothetical protein